MRQDLKKKLISDDHFAHRWLVHGGDDCPDGCNAMPSPTRLAVYLSLTPNTETQGAPLKHALDTVTSERT